MQVYFSITDHIMKHAGVVSRHLATVTGRMILAGIRQETIIKHLHIFKGPEGSARRSDLNEV